MCTAGLFSQDGTYSSEHVIQMVEFAFDCLEAIDSFNNELNTNLEVRIGVNTGGPIIAGIIGNEKPTFDIIGDAINVATRLQSTCISGKIQISESVYEIMSGLSYQIQKRGEVYLKGKGNITTYILSKRSRMLVPLTSQRNP